MAEIEWPLEKDAGISSWRLIVAYHPEGYGSSRRELTQSVELLRRLADALALRDNFSFAAVCECPGVSVHFCFLSGTRCWRIGGGGRCSRGGALRE
jgi:hypothetical protein